MPVLARQLLTVLLGGGLDTEIADKLLPQGKLLELENAVITKTGRISKRPGNSYVGAQAAGTLWKLATRGDSLVSISQTGSTPIEVLTDTGPRWIAPATTLRGPVSAERTPVYSSAGESPNGGDVAYDSTTGLYVVVFDSTSSGGSVVTRRTLMLDAATGQIVYSAAAVGSAASDPRVISIGTSIVVAYHAANGHVFLEVFSSSALAAGTGPTFTWDITPGALAHATSPYFDLRSASSTAVDIAFRSAANTTRRLRVTIGTGAVTIDVEVTTAAAAAVNPSLAIAWVDDFGGSGKIAIATAGPAGVQVQFDLALAGTPAGTYVLDASATGDVRGLTAHTIASTAGGDFVALWDVYNNPLSSSDSFFGKRTVASGIASPVAFIRGVVLESKTFQIGGDVCVLVGFISSTQPTYFMVRVSPTHNTTAIRAPLARFMVTLAQAAQTRRSILTSVPAVGSSFVAALRKQVATNAVGGIFFVDIGVDLAKLTFAPTMGPTADDGDTLFVPGGNLQAFDGQSYTDYGHPIYPEGFAYLSTTGAGGSLSAGDYQWCWVYRYTDANGRVVRSKPSPEVSRTVSANDLVTFTGYYARLHSRPAASDVVVEQYRTAVNGSSFRLEKIYVNDASAASFSATSSASDASLDGAEPLYSTGGVLENDPVRATRALTFFRDRIWFISADDPLDIWASSVSDLGVGYGFSEQVVIRKQDSHGGFTALAGLGLNLFAFKRTAIYAVTGAGPNALGQGDFGEPQEVSVGHGAVDARGVVVSPVGIFFKDPAGIYLLSGAGDPQYVGRPVAAFNGLDIVAARCFPALNQVRFYTGVRTLVYDYLHQQWSVFRHLGTILDAVELGGVQAIAYNSGEQGTLVLTEDTTGTVWSDRIDAYTIKIVTPWISAAGLQGVERVYEIQGIGDNEDAHDLVVTAKYDNDDGPTQDYAKTFSDGDDWEWRLKPARQEATALKLTLEDSFPGVESTEGFSVVALSMLVGVQPAHLKRLQAIAKSLIAQ